MGRDGSTSQGLYRRLGVSPEASAEQIRRAYRRLAHSAHPDTHPEDPEAARRFREVTEAYEILGDPERRARYDSDRRPPAAPQRSSPPPAAGAGATRETPPVFAWTAGQQPVVIPPGAFSAASAPLAASPVRVDPPARQGASGARGASGADLESLLDALFGSWRW